jgi:hypothetical protein
MGVMSALKRADVVLVQDQVAISVIQISAKIRNFDGFCKVGESDGRKVKNREAGAGKSLYPCQKNSGKMAGL